MTKPKLLLVADTYYPKVDGTLKFMEEFVKRAKDDFDLSLLVPSFGEERKNHLPITYVETSKLLSLSGYSSIKFSRKNRKLIKKTIEENDLIFIQGPALLSYLSIYYAAKRKKKSAYYLHVLSWELFTKFLPYLIRKPVSFILKKISLYLYNCCNVILVPYKDLLEQLRKEHVTTNLEVARLGVDINIFSQTKEKEKYKEKLGIKSDKYVIGYVGRISKEKNVSILLEAFQKLQGQEQLHLLIVGDGEEQQKKMFKELTNCTITGFVPHVQNYLKAMDVFVIPSLTETTSLATLEAMSCAVPVIASRVGYIKNYLSKNHNGLFFPANDSTVLATKIEKLRQDKELSQKLGENARKTIAYSFSWERSINKIKKVLLELYYRP